MNFTHGQALMLDVEGTWNELTGIINYLAANLMSQVRSIAKVTKAVTPSDLSKQIEVDCSSEVPDLKSTLNGMDIWLPVFATEVTRVTLEVGSQGKLGRQAVILDVDTTSIRYPKSRNFALKSLNYTPNFTTDNN